MINVIALSNALLKNAAGELLADDARKLPYIISFLEFLVFKIELHTF